MSGDERYRQLAVFSVIVAEVVVTPLLIGGLTYHFLGGHPARTGLSVIGALAGLGLAFYRILKMMKKSGTRNGK